MKSLKYSQNTYPKASRISNIAISQLQITAGNDSLLDKYYSFGDLKCKSVLALFHLAEETRQNGQLFQDRENNFQYCENEKVRNQPWSLAKHDQMTSCRQAMHTLSHPTPSPVILICLARGLMNGLLPTALNTRLPHILHSTWIFCLPSFKNPSLLFSLSLPSSSLSYIC